MVLEPMVVGEPTEYLEKLSMVAVCEASCDKDRDARQLNVSR